MIDDDDGKLHMKFYEHETFVEIFTLTFIENFVKSW